MRLNYILLLSLILLIISGCQKDSPEIENLNENRTLILGHAGAGLFHFNSFPDNSMESIQKAIDGYGIDGVEIDLQLSADSVVFLFHEQLLDHTSVCNGCIPLRSSEYLKDCRYKRNYSITFLREFYLITLEEVFKKYKDKEVYFFLNFKSPRNECYGDYGTEENYFQAVGGEITRLIHKYELSNKVFIEVQNEILASSFKTLDPGLKLFWTTYNVEEGIEKVIKYDLLGIIGSTRNITAKQVQKAHEQNIWVALFGVETENDSKDAVKKSPEIVITDAIDATIKVFNGQ